MLVADFASLMPLCDQVTSILLSLLSCIESVKIRLDRFYRVRINGSHIAICKAFLRFCEANFIQKYKNVKLMKIL